MKIVMALLAAFALLTGGMGIAYAAEEPTVNCETVNSRLAGVNVQLDEALDDLDAALKASPGVKLADAPAVLAELKRNGVVASVIAPVQAIVDANGVVENLKLNVQALESERTTCSQIPTTEVPIENPVETDPPFESCKEALDAGVTLPILKGNENYSENLDSDGDGVACELGDGDGTGGSTDEPTPADPATDNNDSDNDVINPTQFDDIPNTSRGVDTGGL